MVFKPPLPTDNLYKFMAFFGLTLIVLSFVAFYQYHQTSLKVIELESEDNILNLQKEKIKQELEELKEHINKYVYRIPPALRNRNTINVTFSPIDPNNNSDPNFVEEIRKPITLSFENMDKSGNPFAEVFDNTLKKLKLWDTSLTKKQHAELINKNIQYLNDYAKHLSKEDVINRELEYQGCLCNISYIILFAGITLSFIGFYLWYYKLQRFQDMIIKRQAGKNYRKRLKII